MLMLFALVTFPGEGAGIQLDGALFISYLTIN